jgi:hypothetical protein
MTKLNIRDKKCKFVLRLASSVLNLMYHCGGENLAKNVLQNDVVLKLCRPLVITLPV